MLKKLVVEEIYKKCDPEVFGANNTNSIALCDGIIGQERATQALSLAMGMQQSGYNVFALGEGGIGKQRLIRNFLQEKSKNAKIPEEYCYVYNFKQSGKPQYLKFAPYQAMQFKQKMQQLAEDLKLAVKCATEGEAYKANVNTVIKNDAINQASALESLKQEALKQNVLINKVSEGFVIVAFDPKTKSQSSKEQLNNLSPEESKQVESSIRKIQLKLEATMNKIGRMSKSKNEKLKKLKHESIKREIKPTLVKIIKSFSKDAKVSKYLNDIKADVLSNPDQFFEVDYNTQNPIKLLLGNSNKFKNSTNKLEVNIVAYNDSELEKKSGAPVVILSDPTYSQLFGSIDHMSRFGQVSTDFSLINPGALHAANGGYLVVNARPLLQTPMLWYQLKKVIKTSTLPFMIDSSMGNNLVTLDPEPIPFNGKIILLGEPDIYNALWELDPELKELFKITAEFSNMVPLNNKSIKTYAGVIASIVKKENLQPVDKYGLSRIVEIGSKITGSQQSLTTNVSMLIDLLREANFYALRQGKKVLGVTEVDQAYNFRRELRSRVPNFIQDKIKDHTILVPTSGMEVGQINGLSIIKVNEFMFGQPQRISCAVFKGKKDVIDIESNVKLAGAIYSKGVMILSAFLHSRFSRKQILHFSASLSFEQSYGKIDGDSASAASAFAIMSALSNLPISQSLAVTGSIDQKGRVQAIGGVNEKIEGFFDICIDRGLNGTHGVIIPISNVKNLMLKKEVVNAVAKNKFSIYVINHVDEGLELLTGIKVGQINSNDIYKDDSINGIIEKTWLDNN